MVNALKKFIMLARTTLNSLQMFIFLYIVHFSGSCGGCTSKAVLKLFDFPITEQ